MAATGPAVIPLNARVSVAAGEGIVKSVGQTAFAAGKWIGVELLEPNGKNDGSVAGKRYFNCEDGYGVFVRPSQITLLDPVRKASPTNEREKSPIISRTPSVRAATVAPSARAPISNRQSISRPPSIAAQNPTGPRPSISSRASLSISRPSGSALSSSGRSSVASSISRSASPLKPISTVPSRPVSRNVSNSSTGSLGIVEKEGAMLPPKSIISRPSSPKKQPSIPIPASPRRLDPPINFAPPNSGTPRSNSVNSSGIGRPRGSSIVSVESNQSRRSMMISPTQSIGRRSSLAMNSPIKKSPSVVGDLREPPLVSIAAAKLGSPMKSPTKESILSPEKEISDPFSLKGVDSRKILEATVSKREHDELLAKLRILEVRRVEDREKLREVERFKEEAEEWNKVRDKSKAKITELVMEVKELRKQTKDITLERNEFESSLAELTDQVEISVLDKEVAEERFEAIESELLETKEKLDELIVEAGVLREENSRMQGTGEEAGPRGEGGKDSLAYVQLEKQNDRLKDALARLRDLTAETELENRHRIADLEAELDLTSTLQMDYEENVVKLDRATEQIEDLKTQLDDAIGEADMIEELTDKNLVLGDKLEEMHATIEDLEQLTELNDELEQNHIETEKQMQEEIDLKDLQIQDQLLRINSLDDSLVDYSSTISQFRDLVVSLQADLTALRTLHATQTNESEEISSQSQAMLSLNYKLQNSMLKSQIKFIDLELKKLESEQAKTQVSILQGYAMKEYWIEDSHAVEALIFFDQLAGKVQLLQKVSSSQYSVVDSMESSVPYQLIGICQLKSKLVRLETIFIRLAVGLRRCEADAFLKLGMAYRELSAADRRLDYFLQLAGKEELRESDCSLEVDGLIAQGEQLLDLHLGNADVDLVEKELGWVNGVASDLDTISVSVGWSKQALVGLVKEIGGEEEMDDYFTGLQSLVNSARNGKVIASKLLKRLQDLRNGSNALDVAAAQGLETLAFNSSAIASATFKLSHDLADYCSNLRISKNPFKLIEILQITKEAVLELGKVTELPLEEISGLLSQLGLDVGTALVVASDPDQAVTITYKAPWLERIITLQTTAAINDDAERRVATLNEEMKDLIKEMRVKDQSYQESTVKISMMEKRMEAVKKQTEVITELENEIILSKKSEKVYENALETTQSDLEKAQSELVKLKAGGAIEKGTEGESVSWEGDMETSRLIEQIESLRAAVKFLRSENSLLKSRDVFLELEDLPTYSSPRPNLNYAKLTGVNKLIGEVRGALATPIMIDLSSKNARRDPISQLSIINSRTSQLAARLQLLSK